MNIGISVDGNHCTAAFSLSDGRLCCLTEEDGSIKNFSVNDRGIDTLVETIRKKLELLDETELKEQSLAARFSFSDGLAENKRGNIRRVFDNAGVLCECGNSLIEDRTLLCLYAYENMHSFSRPINDSILVICVGQEMIDYRKLQRSSRLLPFESIGFYDDDALGRGKRSVEANSFDGGKDTHIIKDLINASTDQILIFDCRKKDDPCTQNYVEEIVSYIERSGRHVLEAEKQRDYSALGAALIHNNIAVPYWNGLLTDIELDITSYGKKRIIKRIKGMNEFESNPDITVTGEELGQGELRLSEHNPWVRQGAGDRCLFSRRYIDNNGPKEIHFEFGLGGHLNIREELAPLFFGSR